MQSALELIRLNAENTRWQARNIDLTKGYCLTVTDQNHARITFGLDEISQQLDRLFRYLDRADAGKKELQTVNLLVKKNTPVTFHPVEPETDRPIAPPAGPTPSTPPPVQAKAATPIPRAQPVVSTPSPIRAKPENRTGTRSKYPSPTPPVRKPFRP
jgi:hypothetical protein